MTTKLEKYELKVLRHYAGEQVAGIAPGSAFNQASERLRAGGFITAGAITERGRVALRAAGFSA